MGLSTKQLLQLSALAGNMAMAFPGGRYAGQAVQQSAESGIRAEIEKEQEEDNKWYKPKNLLGTLAETGIKAAGAATGNPLIMAGANVAGSAAGAGIRGEDVGQATMKGALDAAIGYGTGKMTDVIQGPENPAPEISGGTPKGAQPSSATMTPPRYTQEYRILEDNPSYHAWTQQQGPGKLREDPVLLQAMEELTQEAPAKTPWRTFGTEFLNQLSTNLGSQIQASQAGDRYSMNVDPKSAIGMSAQGYQAMRNDFMTRQVQLRKDMEFEQLRADELKLTKMKMKNDAEQAELDRQHQQALMEQEYRLRGGLEQTKGDVEVDVAERTGVTALRGSQADYYGAGAEQTRTETQTLPTPEEARAQRAAELSLRGAQAESARASAGASQASAERYRRETETLPTPEEAEKDRRLERKGKRAEIEDTQANAEYKRWLAERGQEAPAPESVSPKDRARMILERANALDESQRYSAQDTKRSYEDLMTQAIEEVDGLLAGETSVSGSRETAPAQELTRDVHDRLLETLPEGGQAEALYKGKPVIVIKRNGELLIMKR